MEYGISLEHSLPDYVVEPVLAASNSATLDEALKCLINISKTPDGRSDLASKNLIVPILRLCQSLCNPSHRHSLLLSLKLLRNLRAGEIHNQNLFIEQKGVGIVSSIVSSVVLASGSVDQIVRMGLQLLGNVSLAEVAIWRHFFSLDFLEMSKVRSKETCDPLCMDHKGWGELFTDEGQHIVVEIVRTVTVAGHKEDWLKLLLSRICLEESYFSSVFSKLSPVGAAENYDGDISKVNHFGAEQAFLLSVLSEILNERVVVIVVSNHFALSILQIMRNAVGIVDFFALGKTGLPTGISNVDVLGCSLSILREICACGGTEGSKKDISWDVVDMLASSGLIELLISLLREPPAILKKTVRLSENQEAPSTSSKCCPYKGFRRDVVAIVGNCAYCRKHIQDKIREQDGMLLLLQQCVTDEDNPFLREWGIWSVRNILEGNRENKQVVASLELQGSVDVPEIAQLGLRVEVDAQTRRVKLVNV